MKAEFRAEVANRLEHTVCDLYISDSSMPPDRYPAKCRIHVSSDTDDRHRYFERDIASSEDRTRNMVSVMAPFSEDEALVLAGFRNIDTETMSLRYLIFGSNFRLLLDTNCAAGHREVQEYSVIVSEAVLTYFEEGTGRAGGL
jgi:hypothetical protein